MTCLQGYKKYKQPLQRRAKIDNIGSRSHMEATKGFPEAFSQRVSHRDNYLNANKGRFFTESLVL